MESYIVRLDKGSITYLPSDYACDSCGYTEQDRSMFYESKGGLFCSLHKEGE